jgi:hypothetical protein
MIRLNHRTGIVVDARKEWRDLAQEATVGFEPTNKGFADLCLTTWLRRREERAKGFEPLTFSLARRHSTAELSPHTLASIYDLADLASPFFRPLWGIFLAK